MPRSEITMEELARRLERQERLVVVDVREEIELRMGRVPGALGIPPARVEVELPGRVPDRKTSIVAYCASGARARRAAAALAALGYEDVTVAVPGFRRWKELGLPFESARSSEHVSIGASSPLTPAQRERYARHLLVPEIGDDGQAKLLAGKVLIVGAGGLGSPAALYLAAAGVGTLGIVDADVVDASNLQRQVLHATSRLGVAKTESARAALSDLNPEVSIVPHEERLTTENVERLLSPYDIIVDGADNFPTRYLLSDASVWLGKPLVQGSVARFEGRVSTFVSARAAARLGVTAGPCYRCLFPEPPPPHLAPSCAEAGVLGIVPGMIGVLQATEVVKLLAGIGEPLVGRLFTYDALATRARELRFKRDRGCLVCGDAPRVTSYVDYDAFCGA